MDHLTTQTSVEGRLEAALAGDIDAQNEITNLVRSKYIKSKRDSEIAHGVKFILDRLSQTGTPNQRADNSRKPEGRGLAVIGQSGDGKTTSIERHLKEAFPDYGTPGSLAVSITMPSLCSLKQMLRAIINGIGYPIAANRGVDETFDVLQRKLAETDIKILHIDELQNVTSTANAVESQRIKDTFKSFLNHRERPIALILSGLPKIKSFIEDDGQLRRRMHIVALERVTPNQISEIEKTAAGLCKTGGLAIDTAGDLLPRLIHAAGGAMGLAIEMICDAIDVAIRNKSAVVTRSHFATQYTARSACGPLANIFLAHSWSDINSNKIMSVNAQDDLVEAAKAAQQLRRAKR